MITRMKVTLAVLVAAVTALGVFNLFSTNERTEISGGELHVIRMPLQSRGEFFQLTCADVAGGYSSEEAANAAVEYFRVRLNELREGEGLSALDEQGRSIRTSTGGSVRDAIAAGGLAGQVMIRVLDEMAQEFPCEIEIQQYLN